MTELQAPYITHPNRETMIHHLCYCTACGVSYAAAFPMTYCPECGMAFGQTKEVDMDEQTLREYYDALVRIDELSLQLGRTLSNMRVGWDEEKGERSDCLKPINDIARLIGEAMPESIRSTRTMIGRTVAEWGDRPIKVA